MRYLFAVVVGALLVGQAAGAGYADTKPAIPEFGGKIQPLKKTTLLEKTIHPPWKFSISIENYNESGKSIGRVAQGTGKVFVTDHVFEGELPLFLSMREPSNRPNKFLKQQIRFESLTIDSQGSYKDQGYFLVTDATGFPWQNGSHITFDMPNRDRRLLGRWFTDISQVVFPVLSAKGYHDGKDHEFLAQAGNDILKFFQRPIGLSQLEGRSVLVLQTNCHYGALLNMPTMPRPSHLIQCSGYILLDEQTGEILENNLLFEYRSETGPLEAYSLLRVSLTADQGNP
ncbi:hypothetical protein [Aestuariispira insulae]|uniref:Uncharacterized protein n=1 Tax=Aestuariispira insulae TaxID=1461337 RepID=A0A3D9HI10_9PROT|nr:hypothetical protein [Aestuariispira insulae]RED48596.1 hypothetical protein DFP90_107100 [Aestuariispira insulae]